MQTFDSAGNLKIAAANALSLEQSAFAINGFRLSLTSNVAVTTSDVTAAGTLYLVPVGNNSLTNTDGGQIALYYSGAWGVYQSTGVSLSLTLTSGKNYDVYAYYSGSAIVLELSSAWTGDTDRSNVPLVLQDGVLVKSGDATRRYLGTIRASGSNTTEDSLAKRFVWNCYNRRLRPMSFVGSSSHTYSTSTWRYWNNSSASRFEFVQGLAEDAVHVFGAGAIQQHNACVGIGVDANTPTNPDGTIGTWGPQSAAAAYFAAVPVTYTGLLSVGYHYIALLEYSFGSAATFFGSYTYDSDNTMQTNLYGHIWG